MHRLADELRRHARRLMGSTEGGSMTAAMIEAARLLEEAAGERTLLREDVEAQRARIRELEVRVSELALAQEGGRRRAEAA